MQFLITGTAGFIGFHLAKRLLEAGHPVTGFDGMTDYYDVALKQARLEQLLQHNAYRHKTAMLENRAALDEAAGWAKPDVIVHLAAQAGVRYSIEAPASYVDSNLVGSFNVLELARDLRPQHLMLGSTSSVYGANQLVPFEETHKADEPLNLYAATKKGMEAMGFSYSQLFSIPTTTLRFFTVYGPWGRPDMALFKFVSAIRAGRPIDVYSHGKMGRDFTFIDDLVESIGRLAQIAPSESNRLPADTLSAAAPYRTVNIANGEPVRLMDFVGVVQKCLGLQATINMLPEQPGEMQETFGDATLLRTLTGFAPQIGIEEGVAAFVDWYRGFYG